MITRKQGFFILKTIAECAWNRLPDILLEIPATATTGKVLREVKKLCEDVKVACKSKEENDNSFEEDIRQLMKKYGGEREFKEKLYQELETERELNNPEYINAAIFLIDGTEGLSEAEQQILVDTLKGNIDVATLELSNFVRVFCEEYFGNDYEACDYPIEVGKVYIAFNFDDMKDHPYDEEDLTLIRDMLNQIIGRNAFCKYGALGTDDSVGY